MLDDAKLQHLRRCLELATEALEAGDEPFGSVLVAEDGTVLAEDHNRVASGDRTRHPEFELARWAAANLTPGERAAATVFTSGEHCPMCAAAHGWVGLGRIASWWKARFRSLRNRYATCTGAFTEHPEPQDGDPGTGWLHAGQPLLRLEAANADLVSPSA